MDRFISCTGSADHRDIERPEGFSQRKTSNTQQGNKRATFRVVTPSLSQLRYRVAQKMDLLLQMTEFRKLNLIIKAVYYYQL